MSEEDPRPAWGRKLSVFCCIPQRVVIIIFTTIGLLLSYALNTSFNITIIQIVKPRNLTGDGSEEVCQANKADFSDNEISTEGKYDWDQRDQSILLIAYFAGYISTQVPGGMLAQKIGGVLVLGIGVACASTSMLLLPVATEYFGYPAVAVLRCILGFCVGPQFPCVSVIVSKWVPKRERSILGVIAFSGYLWGTIVAICVAGQILVVAKWHYVFYIFGTAGITWAILFILFCSRDPTRHPYIKLKERDYLQQELGDTSQKLNLKTPWKAIFTSMPFYAILSAQIGHDWGFYVLLSYLPKYINDVLHVSMKNNSIMSAMPFLTMWIISVITGVIGDCLVNKELCKLINVRRTFTLIAGIGPAVGMVVASYAGCNFVVVTVLFCVTLGFMACYYAGFRLQGNELSPNFSGVLMGISNGCGVLCGLAVPFITGVMTPNTTLSEWRNVFWLAFVVQIVTVIFYSIFTSSDLQPWDDPAYGEQKKA